MEPLIKKQWFVRMDELIKPAVKAVKEGEIRLVPKSAENRYFNWTDNIRDWCISRQLWWGHRIPAWTCADCGEITVARTAPAACPKCGGTHLDQDPDVLDTWFSSALWPFETLGWPDETPELKYFFPTDVLVTGWDIIFFWVIRMIFSRYEQMGTYPFHTVIFGLRMMQGVFEADRSTAGLSSVCTAESSSRKNRSAARSVASPGFSFAI